MQRYLSIDILRAVAILLMIQVHFVTHLSGYDRASAWLYSSSGWLGVIPAPLFTFLSGLSFCLWMRKQEASGPAARAGVTKTAIRRGLFLFGAGLALNFFVWLPEETFIWDILTLLGAALIILAFARRLPVEILALICVMLVLVSPPLRVVSEYAVYWDDENYSYDFNLRDIVFGFFLNGYFPLLPWLIFPFVGFLVADVAFVPSSRSDARLTRLAALGLAFMVVSVLVLLLGDALPTKIARHYASGLTMYPASTEQIFGTLGLSMFSIAVLHRWIDRRPPDMAPGSVLRFVQRWSAFSLTIYIVHLAAHLWPMWIYGVWMGHDDPTFYYHNAMTTPAALALALLFVVVASAGLLVLEKHRQYSFESLMRWICD